MATQLLTLDEFLDLPEPPELVRRELLDGVVVETNRAEMGTANRTHEIVKGRIAEALAAYAHENRRWFLLAESMFGLGPRSGQVPDVALAERQRVLDDPRAKRPFTGSPELAVEVVSSDAAATLERKVFTYLSAGSQLVWVFYPELRHVWVYRPDGTAQRVGEGDMLTAPELLPGFAVPVAELFEGL